MNYFKGEKASLPLHPARRFYGFVLDFSGGNGGSGRRLLGFCLFLYLFFNIKS